MILDATLATKRKQLALPPDVALPTAIALSAGRASLARADANRHRDDMRGASKHHSDRLVNEVG